MFPAVGRYIRFVSRRHLSDKINHFVWWQFGAPENDAGCRDMRTHRRLLPSFRCHLRQHAELDGYAQLPEFQRWSGTSRRLLSVVDRRAGPVGVNRAVFSGG